MKKIPLKFVSTFSGVGMQERGIENTGLFDLDVLATCETDHDAIVSYAAIHNGLTYELIENYTDYPSNQEMAQELIDMNIGYDFKKDKPYDWGKLANAKENSKRNIQLKKVWLACKLNKNVGDVSRVDTFPRCDMLSFSFPCTDISVAGHQEGMVEGTRSGLVYQITRILYNMDLDDNLPSFLLMENVDALINKKNLASYLELNKEFEELGYGVKYDVINTKNTGIPQNRNRVFAIYYLKEKYNLDNFKFPIPFDSGIRLKDILLDNVDEKYYIENEKSQALLEELIANGKLDGYLENNE